MSREHDPTARAGFSDWGRAAQNVGNYALRHVIEQMDPGTVGGVNPHHTIIERLRKLDLPHHAFIAMTCEKFLRSPDAHRDQLSSGNYYFASIVPGLHLAHETDWNRVISFVETALCERPELKNTELYISHNGTTAMSGHIIIKPDAPPSPIVAEFTIGNFNRFHRGSHAPEITVQRTGSEKRLTWDFRDALQPATDFWQTDERFVCDDAVSRTRQELAQLAYHAVSLIPHDDDSFLPGYYEVLMEHGSQEGAVKPIFIEAITKAGNTLPPALLR